MTSLGRLMAIMVVEIAAMPLEKTRALSASSQIASRSSRISRFGLLIRE
jgi:hypothetical protein